MVCPEQVHQKTDLGAVTYEGEKCIGCQNCLTVCPFNIPNINWTDDSGSLWVNTVPEITRCKLCFDRVNNGEQPACTKACSTGALTFGNRDELLIKARARIVKWPNKYVDHIYGEKEVGGTAWLYLSPVPFEKLGFMVLPDEPLDVSQYKDYHLYPTIVPEKEPVSPVNAGITGAVIGLGAGVTGVLAAIQLRRRGSEEVQEQEDEPEE
jgi:ferredoxin